MTAPRNTDDRIDAFLAEGLTDLPDRAFDVVRSDIHRTRQRVVLGPWREPNMSSFAKLAAAAALMVAIGFAWIRFGPVSSVGTPSLPPASAPASTPGPTAPAAARLLTGSSEKLVPGRYRIAYENAPGTTDTSGPSIDFTIAAEGWYDVDGASVDWVWPDGITYGPSFSVWNITNVYADPCTDHTPRATAPGPGIDALLEALAAQDGIDAGPLTAVTIDGYAGKFVDLTIKADIVACPVDFMTWGDEGAGRDAKGTGEIDRVYALEVDGQRITFFTRIIPGGKQEHIPQLRAIVESIDIQP